MTATIHALAKAFLLSLHPVAARTATGNGTGVDCLDYEGTAAVVLGSTAGTGTTPTLDVTLEESDDDSTYTAVPAAAYDTGTNFTQVVGTASQQIRRFSISDRKRYLRAKHTIAGTTPSFTYSLNLLAQKKYS